MRTLTTDDVGMTVPAKDIEFYRSPADHYEEAQALTPYTYAHHSASRDCDGRHGHTVTGLVTEFDQVKDGSLETVARQLFGLYLNMPWDRYEKYEYDIRPLFQTVTDYDWGYDAEMNWYFLKGITEREILNGYEFTQAQTTDEGYRRESLAVLHDPWDDTHDEQIDEVFDEYAQRMGY